MAEEPLGEVQVELLARFRRISEVSERQLADLERRFREAVSAADSRLARAKSTAQEELEAVTSITGEVRELVEANMLMRRVVAECRAEETALRPDADASVEMARCATRAAAAQKGIPKSLGLVRIKAERGTSEWFQVVGCLAALFACGGYALYVWAASSKWGLLAVVLLIAALVYAFTQKDVLERRLRDHYTEMLQSEADARAWHRHWVERAQQERDANVAEARSVRDRGLATANATAAASLSELKSEVTQYATRVDSLSPQWSQEPWLAWRPPDQVVGHLRLGQLRATNARHRLALPGVHPFPGGASLLIKSPGSRAERAASLARALMARMTTSVPPGRLRFTLVDPVGLGQNVASYMQLADYMDALVTSRAWTEEDHIARRLHDITQHMENVFQKYLRGQYDSIEEYNRDAGEVAEAYRVVVVFDFPTNFTEESARRLVSIVTNGPRSGVYALLVVDTDRKLPHGFDLAELERFCSVIEVQGEGCVVADERFARFELVPESPPASEVIDGILQTVGERAVEDSRVEVEFDSVLPQRESWWSESADETVSVPLGLAGARRVQRLELGKSTQQHAVIAGKTGSGKTTLLHVLITNLALRYSPDEVELYLIDFKEGVEFKPYAVKKLPHARVVAIESEREFGLSVIEGLDEEVQRRGQLFREAEVDELAQYRRRTGEALPRILLIVDEFQVFFVEEDETARKASQILDRLVRQGRAFGVHVILGSQTLAGAYSLARSTVDQMAIRIALQCTEADSRLILADDNPAARLLERPGEAIYNAANGLIEGNNLFQTAWLPDDEHDDWLRELIQFAQEREHAPSRSLVVFEGNAPARLTENDLLAAAIAGEGVVGAPGTESVAPTAWLGEPVAMRPSVGARFVRQAGSNLLIVGRNDETATALIAAAALSLAAHFSPDPDDRIAPIQLLDYGAADGSRAGYLRELAQRLAGYVGYGRRRQLPGMIEVLHAEVTRRSTLDEEGMAPICSPIFLVVFGLQRARDLHYDEMMAYRRGDEEEGPSAPEPSELFRTIVHDGPEVGVHTLMWCNTIPGLERAMDRRTQREIAMRVGMQMSSDDSVGLIDTPAASRLGPYRAILYNEDEGRLVKFRPYGLLEPDDLARMTAKLVARVA